MTVEATGGSFGRRGPESGIKDQIGWLGLVYLSVHHTESLRVIEGLLSRTEDTPQGREIFWQGDGRSQGTILIAAGEAQKQNHKPDPKHLTVAFLHLTSGAQYASFRVSGNLLDLGEALPKGYARVQGTPFCYNPKTVEATGAWNLTREIGHEAQPEKTALSLDEALDWWENNRKIWRLNHNVESFYFPRKLKVIGIKKRQRR